MILKVELPDDSYNIIIEHGCLNKINEYFKLDRKVLILTDTGVPAQYSQTIASFCKEPYIMTIKQGEESKSFAQYETILLTMIKYKFTRKDCVVACGGGVCGDLAGFVAATYMRGIDFYNCPTTVLSQVDSSVGGKTAIDLAGYKNMVGAFYQPRCVVIDPEVLKTLPQRQINNGLVEALKAGVFYNKELFDIFENQDIMENIDTIIYDSLVIKRDVVQQDEREKGIRKVLNFGHTLGHGVEAMAPYKFHGECVALGMLPMTTPEIRERLKKIYKVLDLDTEIHVDIDMAMQAVLHDKKVTDNLVDAVIVDEIGTFRFEKMNYDQLKERMSIIVK